MQVGEEQELSIEEFFTLCQDEGSYQIDSPDGWQDVGDLVKKKNKECYNIVLENGAELGCSFDHYVWTRNHKETQCWKKIEDIDVQKDFILTDSGFQKIVAKENIGIRDTFDLEVKSLSHKYYSNRIVSHNTGKSMAAEAIASAYKMPLLRLDVGAIFSSHVGESEANIRATLKVAESISPCVFWIDEVEKGIGGVESSNSTDGGVTSRIFGTLLSWMQDKQSPVFVVCTANKVSGIPPEFMRAGRFDEIFFLDLPNDDQRFDVVKKLVVRKGRKIKDFDLAAIVLSSENYTPAEIEKGIDNALFKAYADNKRKLCTLDIVESLKSFPPLYNSRREEINEMRDWAFGDGVSGGRAVKANSIKLKHNSTSSPSKRGRKNKPNRMIEIDSLDV